MRIIRASQERKKDLTIVSMTPGRAIKRASEGMTMTSIRIVISACQCNKSYLGFVFLLDDSYLLCCCNVKANVKISTVLILILHIPQK